MTIQPPRSVRFFSPGLGEEGVDGGGWEKGLHLDDSVRGMMADSTRRGR